MKDLSGYSVDFVWMEGPAAGHTHTKGEINLGFAMSGKPLFDGRPPGWVVFPPGSHHIPTVTGGEMLLVYFLPGGAGRVGSRRRSRRGSLARMTAARRRPIAWGFAALAIGALVWSLLRARGIAIDAGSERAAGSVSVAPPAPIAAPELAASGASRVVGIVPSEPPVAGSPADVDVPVTTLEFVDADTGAPVTGCELLEPFVKESQLPTVPVVGHAAEDSPDRVEVARFRELANPHPYRTPLQRSVRVPPGRAIARRSLPGVPIARSAHSFRFVQPVHREVDVRVTFVDDSGQPSRGGMVVAWRVGDFVQRPAVVETIAGGRVRLRGVPFVSGATLRLRCEIDPDPDSEYEAPPLGIEEIIAESEDTKFDSPFRWPMPASFRETIDARVPIATLAEPTILDHCETDNDLPTEESLGEDGVPATGSVRIDVRGRDGKPVEGVFVSLGSASGWTAADGVVAVAGVAVGPRSVSILEPGRVFATETFDVVANREARATFHELEGGTLDIEVVDAEGSAAPFARLTIQAGHGPAWLDIDDAGEQRLDPFTDVRGRRTCRRISPGRVTVAADRGDGHVKVEVELRDGERKALRLELR